jgi:hypothetical protein
MNPSNLIEIRIQIFFYDAKEASIQLVKKNTEYIVVRMSSVKQFEVK